MITFWELVPVGAGLQGTQGEIMRIPSPMDTLWASTSSKVLMISKATIIRCHQLCCCAVDGEGT